MAPPTCFLEKRQVDKKTFVLLILGASFRVQHPYICKLQHVSYRRSIEVSYGPITDLPI